jgi:hypothetical protein
MKTMGLLELIFQGLVKKTARGNGGLLENGELKSASSWQERPRETK